MRVFAHGRFSPCTLGLPGSILCFECAAAHSVLERDSVDSVLILDCDFHRGDGTDAILVRLGDDRIHHESLGFCYSRRHQASSYLADIQRIANNIESGRFDFVIYQAGMDVLLGDPAGGGILSFDETRHRDQIVFSACSRSSTPIVWNLAGGYQAVTENGFDAVVEGALKHIRMCRKRVWLKTSLTSHFLPDRSALMLRA